MPPCCSWRNAAPPNYWRRPPWPSFQCFFQTTFGESESWDRKKRHEKKTILPAIASTSGHLHSEFIRILFLQAHRETDRFFSTSGVMSSQSDRGFFHYRLTVFSSILKSRVGNILAKDSVLRINLHIDGSPIVSKSHTHPSHSQTSRLLTLSLSLGVPVPRPTQCLRGV
jgi:hypothetical protein